MSQARLGRGHRLVRRSIRCALFVVLAFAAALTIAGCAARTVSTASVSTQTTKPRPTTSTTFPRTTSTTVPPTTTTFLRPTTTLTPATTPASTATLSPLQLAGQRVIYSYTGLTPPAGLLSLVSHGEAAGVVFFGDNISSHAQIRSVIQTLELADASPQNPVRAPLLLMIDQEGGNIRRLSGAPLLSEKQIGASPNPMVEATKAGTAAGINLHGVGIDVNLAPVLDVYRSAGDFEDQRGRSYSMSPDLVATLGANFIIAQQRAGVAATAKHFPGLGSATTTQNTDERPVTLSVSRQSLGTIDESSYDAAIAAGVRLVMVSWAVYPALDPSLPAGLSSLIVQGQLRERLHFQGVTITDAIEAKALGAFGTTQHRAVLAARAGMDLILCSSGEVAQGEQARDGLAGR
jgi:beta-N-acetylhexosaminidase